MTDDADTQSMTRRPTDNTWVESDAVMTPETPLRRCADCRLNLGDVFLAVFTCPLFGRPRQGVETRCNSFKPKETL